MVSRELGGLGQLAPVRLEQTVQQALRTPFGIEGEAAEEMGEALLRPHLAKPPLHLHFLERVDGCRHAIAEIAGLPVQPRERPATPQRDSLERRGLPS